ncbi:hypothetical protein AC579_6590 [Pseudocercospora musae]|uniref:Uncharacterized protein n=1 Tax=Pseudocercospora musae TaxID=113226 RepID=A0A139IAG7_9PEZI|nr:hypothetical protein AC579_6590 [Pseudocercospora musae]
MATSLNQKRLAFQPPNRALAFTNHMDIAMPVTWIIVPLEHLSTGAAQSPIMFSPSHIQGMSIQILEKCKWCYV